MGSKELTEVLFKGAIKKFEPWMETFSKESDRSVSIVGASLLDTLLEELIKEFYVKDSSIKDLFNSDHMLMSLYSKIHIAYYSGYINKTLFHDLKIICKIRNKFAHSLESDLNFGNNQIKSMIQQCELRPKTLDSEDEPKLKIIMVITQIATFLYALIENVKEKKPKHWIKLVKLHNFDMSQLTITKQEIDEIMIKNNESDNNDS